MKAIDTSNFNFLPVDIYAKDHCLSVFDPAHGVDKPGAGSVFSTSVNLFG